MKRSRQSAPTRDALRTEPRVHELGRAEDVGDPLAFVQGVEGRDVQALRAGHEIIDAASRVDDAAEADGDVAAQALRPRLPPGAVQFIPEGVRRGRSVAPGDQRCQDGEPRACNAAGCSAFSARVTEN